MARILVIDDDELMWPAITQMLESAGHQVATAADGEDGVGQFRENPADLVICDIFMPRESGIAALGALRKISSSLPVVVMSGGAPRSPHIPGVECVDYLEVAKVLGATATIRKPFNASDLIEIVNGALAGEGTHGAWRSRREPNLNGGGMLALADEEIGGQRPRPRQGVDS